MDKFGSFDSSDQHAATSATDAGVEAPPEIGTDERRMHVRAYNYWVSLLDGRAYPAIEDLEPENLTDFGPNSVLLDFSEGAENPAVSYLGAGLRKECDLDESIQTIGDVPSRSLLSRLTDHYLQIIANRAPIGFEAEFVNQRGNNTMYRGILMPFSSDDDTIDFIYGVINWKEVADAELTASLTDEFDRAIASAPRPAEHVPVWADGPSAEMALDHDDDEEDDEVAAFEPDGTEGLGDWLAAARDLAETAKSAEGRSRNALYKALGLAYDFALAADENADDYAELLSESGLTAQDRAPMTPVVKLVFGIDYDKTRLAEYAAALTYGRRHNVARGGMSDYLTKFSGGLKALVSAERAERRPATDRPQPENRALDRARKLEPKGIVQIPGDEEFVVLIARRVDGEHVAVLGKAAHDDALVERALRRLAP